MKVNIDKYRFLDSSKYKIFLQSIKTKQPNYSASLHILTIDIIYKELIYIVWVWANAIVINCHQNIVFRIHCWLILDTNNAGPVSSSSEGTKRAHSITSLGYMLGLYLASWRTSFVIGFVW